MSDDDKVSLVVTLALLPLQIYALVLGVKAAKRKGISPHWMWFGFHPFTAFIAYAVIAWVIERRTECPSCHRQTSPKYDFCPGCKTALQESRKKEAQRRPIRWWGAAKVACASCGRFVSMKSPFCPSCSGPTPRLVCPGCGSDHTQLVARCRTEVTVGVVCFLIARAGLGYVGENISGGLTLGNVIMILGAGIPIVVFGGASIACFVAACGPSSKRIVCSTCNKESPIDTAKVSLSVPAPKRAPAGTNEEPVAPIPPDWYYKLMGEEHGPVSPHQLKQLARTGTITPDSLVRKGAHGDWVLADRVRGLFT